MSWIIYALIAIALIGVSDLFRKLASDIKDPIFTNLVFQIRAFAATIVMFSLSRKVVNNSKGILFALVGGVLVAVFLAVSF